MPNFIKTPIQGRLAYIGYVNKREDDLKSIPLETTTLTLDGIKGEDHGGRTRASCVRVSMMYPKGTVIANARQVSVMSKEELSAMAADAGITQNLPEWWGASLAFEGIPELSALPPSSRIIFPNLASIRVDVENGPCVYTAKEVASQTGGDAPAILAAAKNRRGVVGSIEREGEIKLGDIVQVVVPIARPYPYSGN